MSIRYEPLESSNSADDAHGIPLTPIRPEYEPAVVVTVGGSAAVARHNGMVSAPGASAPLYYGESAGLYTPISQNQVIERDNSVVVVPAQHQTVAPTVVTVPSAAAAPASNAYPAQAYAQTYAGAPQQSYAVAQPIVVNAAGQPIAPAPAPTQFVSIIPPIAQSKEQLARQLAGRRVQFDCNRYLREGWTFARANWCFLFGSFLFFAVFFALAYVALYAIFVSAGWEPRWYENESHHSTRADGVEEYEVSGGYYGGWSWGRFVRELLFEALFAVPVGAGYCAAFFEAMRNNSHMKFRTLFSAYSCPYWIRLVGLSFMLSLLTRVLALLFVIPGIYFAVVTAFAVPLHLENRHIPLRTCHAMAFSIRTLSSYCCEFFGFVLLLSLINVGGALLFGLGLLITVPVTAAAFAYCYHHLIGVNGMPIVVPAQTANAMMQEAAHAQAAAAAAAAARVATPQLQNLAQPVVVVVAPAAA